MSEGEWMAYGWCRLRQLDAENERLKKIEAAAKVVWSGS